MKSEKNFDYRVKFARTLVYVKFIESYEFSDLPDGFVQDEKRRNLSEIQMEIETYNKILYEWASKLPDINERNDKNE